VTLTVGSLFSGIGGLDLGLERAGMQVIWQSEIDPYACKVLSKHWPEVVNHGDIKKINWKEIERPNVICGGYPCQPFSTAGKRRGEEDPRHLWPWVREAISQLRPDYAILENVRGHLSMGGLSVVAELASIGYDCEWRVVSAASVGANHRRDRIIIVAYPQSQYGNVGDNHTRVSAQSETLSKLGNSGGTKNVAYPDSCDAPNGRQCENVQSQNPIRGDDRTGSRSDIGQIGMGSTGQDSGNVANTDNNGPSATTLGGGVRKATDRTSPRKDNSTNTQGRSSLSEDVANANCEGRQGGSWIQEPEQKSFRFDLSSPNLGRSQTLANNECQWHGKYRLEADAGQENRGRLFDGRREEAYVGWQWWQFEPDVGRVAHGVPSRVDRLRGLGNAVVPQVAEVIGRLVIEHANA